MTRDARSLRPARTRRFLVRTALTSFLLIFGSAGLSAGTMATATAKTSPDATSRVARMADGTYEHRVQRWINVVRTNRGLRPLRFQRCADGTAERWSRHLARTNLFYHQPMTRVLNRCNARYAGETLARGSIYPRRLVRMWMQSPPHRLIVLSSQPRRIGIGATLDRHGRWVVAANFVRP